MDEVAVVVAHRERATLRVGDAFIKVDGDRMRSATEGDAMEYAPIPTPAILWREPHVLAIAAVPGRALGHLGEPSTASPGAWRAAGAAIRRLHDAAPPAWAGPRLLEIAPRLDEECDRLIAHDLLPASLVAENRRIAQAAFRPWTPVFIHGDLQPDHVFVDGDDVTGVIDWSDAGEGDALWDLAILTMGFAEHLDDLLAGYGADLDRDVIRAWWSVRGLMASRWLIEHGFDPDAPGCEFDVLRAQVE